MRKWKLAVWGLLLSVFLGMTGMKAEAAVRVVSEEEDIELISATTQKRDADGNKEEIPLEVEQKPWNWEEVGGEFFTERFWGHYYISEWKETDADVQLHLFGMEPIKIQNSIRKTLKVRVPGIRKGLDKVKVLMCYSDEGELSEGDWWLEPDSFIEDEIVEVSFSGSLYDFAGPIAVVVINENESPAEPSAPSDGAGESVSLAGETAAVKDSAAGEEISVAVTAENTEEALSSETIRTLTGSEREYRVHKLDVKLWRDGNEISLADGQSVELSFRVPGVTSDSDVRVLHFAEGAWEADSASVTEKGDGYVKARFTSLSPVAFLVYNEPKSSGSSHRSRRTEAEDTFWSTPLSSGASVTVNGAAADLQIGPATWTCSQEEAQSLLGTAGSCSVYTADLWLLDQATKDMVLPGPEGVLVTLNVPGVTKSSNVRVRHWPNGSTEAADLVPVEIGDGYVKIRLTSLGQVAVCVSNTGAAVPVAVPAAEENVRKSPRTSDGMMMFGAEAAAVLSLLGFIVFKKRNVIR